MIDWCLNPAYAGSVAAALFSNIDRVFALEGELIADDRPVFRWSRVGGVGLPTLPTVPIADPAR